MVDMNDFLTDELILQIDNLLEEWASPAVALGFAAHENEEIPQKYTNDEIYMEYYNGIRQGKTSTEMRKICLPKFIRRELPKHCNQ